MKKLLILMAAGTAAIAAPAAAQTNGNNGYAYGNQNMVNAQASANLQNRIMQLETRLQAGIQSGAITRSEATSLRTQVRTLTRLERQYSRNGLTQAERQDLQQRLRAVRQQFRIADGGGNGQWADSDVENGGYYGQGGAYEEVTSCERGSGGGLIGGVLGGILGNRGNDCIEPGERAPTNLGAVPYELRNQFRDGNGIVYRSDGRNVYQIDVRTNTVLRVYGAPR
ncbi:MAG TPA: hypothetical protein VF552_08615 [Allosphingosinicella sp.]|jgi:hypothetical protein